jgi:hypothetical protein
VEVIGDGLVVKLGEATRAAGSSHVSPFP